MEEVLHVPARGERAVLGPVPGRRTRRAEETRVVLEEVVIVVGVGHLLVARRLERLAPRGAVLLTLHRGDGGGGSGEREGEDERRVSEHGSGREVFKRGLELKKWTGSVGVRSCLTGRCIAQNLWILYCSAAVQCSTTWALAVRVRAR